MRRIFRFVAAAAILAAALSSCKSQYEILLNSNDVDLKYEAAFQYYNEAKYTKAAALFESMSVLTSGTERDDTVQYYWGLSNYKAKDYVVAETNFQNFIESYPRSPFASEARFLRLDCLYRSTLRYELDQALDTKAFEAARLYYKMEDYIASRVTFRNILKDDAETMYREDILYYIAMSSYKYAQLSVVQKQKDRYMTFVDDYLNFIGEYPDSGYRRELDAIYRRVQRLLGRYPGAEAVPEEIDEKAFMKERRRMERDEQSLIRKDGKTNERLVDDSEQQVILDGMANEAEAKSIPEERQRKGRGRKN